MRKAILALLVANLLSGCHDPLEKPAKEVQLKKVEKIMKQYPEVKDDYIQAQADGVVSKGELLAIIKKIKKIKESREQNN